MSEFRRMGLLLACAAFPARGQEWTERAVVERFLEQSPIARETRARAASVEAETKGRTLWTNPTLGASHEGAGRTEFYQVAQTLPTSGRFPLIRQAGAFQTEVVNHEGGAALWSARCALRAAFYRTLAAQERQRVWAEAEGDLNRVIAILREREREGEGSKFDRVRAERERIEITASSRLLDADIASSRGDLLAYLPAGTSLATVVGSLAGVEPRASLAELIERALAHRLDIQAERRRLEQLRKEQQVAARLRIPEPVVTAGVKRAEAGLPQLASGPVVGLSWALPVFNQGKTEVARWGAEHERTAARLEQLTRRVQAAVQGAWQAYAVNREALAAYASAQEASTDELVQIATVAYQEGEVGILQLLDAYRLRRESRLRLVDLAAWAKQAQIQLETQLGEELP